MERPDLERIKQGLFSIGSAKNNPIIRDFEAVLTYALQLEAEKDERADKMGVLQYDLEAARKERDDARRYVEHAAADCAVSTAERDDARKMLGECFVLSGADTDGDGWEYNWPHAVEAVRELRKDYDESTK